MQRKQKALLEKIQEIKEPLGATPHIEITQQIIEIEYTPEVVAEIVQQQTLRDLQEVISSGDTKRPKAFPGILELEQELQRINTRHTHLQIQKVQIETVSSIDTAWIDTKVAALQKEVSESQEEKRSYFKKPQKLLQRLLSEFDTLFSKSLFKRYQDREAEIRRKEQQREKELKIKLGALEGLIAKARLQEAKNLLIALETQVTPSRHSALLGHLRQAQKSYNSKCQEVLEKQKQELLRKQREEAERQRLIEEAKLEEVRILAAQAALIKQLQVEYEERRKRELTSLLILRSDWKDFETVLKQHGITSLYHFTDKSNIASIKKNGGLYSWYYCDRNDIRITMPGGGFQSRVLDREHKLEDYVRLSFIMEHPMMHIALKDDRIKSPVILKVKPEVCFFFQTRFADMNAADRRHKNGDSIQFFRQLRYDLFNKSYFSLDGMDKKYYQAEVMVKTWIPIDYITNI